MKNKKLSFGGVTVLCAVMATTGLAGAYAQDVTTTTSITMSGSVSELTPGTITVTSGPAALPVSYSYSKTTTYVDENGNSVSAEVIRTGVPVTVYYTQDGDHMLASKVIVRHDIPTDGETIIKKTTTTTTTPGQ